MVCCKYACFYSFSISRFGDKIFAGELCAAVSCLPVAVVEANFLFLRASEDERYALEEMFNVFAIFALITTVLSLKVRSYFLPMNGSRSHWLEEPFWT
jgi:hypothetical protein